MSTNFQPMPLWEILKKPRALREPLLGDWLSTRRQVMVYAPSGLGKSWFAIGIACAVAGGSSFAGWDAPKANHVLYIDGELDTEDIHERMTLMARSLPGLADADGNPTGDLLEKLHIASFMLHEAGFIDINKTADQDHIFKFIKEKGIKLVIMDNFSTLATVEDENAATSFNSILTFIQKLKRSQVASILVHHTRKLGQEDIQAGKERRKSASGQTYSAQPKSTIAAFKRYSADDFRGTQKMSVIFDFMLRLAPTTLVFDGKPRFSVNFVKSRAETTPVSRDVYFKGPLDEGTKEAPTGWLYKETLAETLIHYASLIKDLHFCIEGDLAVAMGYKHQGTFTKIVPSLFVAFGLFSDLEDYKKYFSEAKAFKKNIDNLQNTLNVAADQNKLITDDDPYDPLEGKIEPEEVTRVRSYDV